MQVYVENKTLRTFKCKEGICCLPRIFHPLVEATYWPLSEQVMFQSIFPSCSPQRGVGLIAVYPLHLSHHPLFTEKQDKIWLQVFSLQQRKVNISLDKCYRHQKVWFTVGDDNLGNGYLIVLVGGKMIVFLSSVIKESIGPKD